MTTENLKRSLRRVNRAYSNLAFGATEGPAFTENLRAFVDAIEASPALAAVRAPTEFSNLDETGKAIAAGGRSDSRRIEATLSWTAAILELHDQGKIEDPARAAWSFVTEYLHIMEGLAICVPHFISDVIGPVRDWAEEVLEVAQEAQEDDASLGDREEREHTMPPTPPLDLFISHSSYDKPWVEPLARLLETALHFSPKRIRCTSVDRYALTPGASVDSTLKQEVTTARFVLGVITPKSIKSSFVLFELGARWGVDEDGYLAILAPGLDAENLPGPLKGKHAIGVDTPQRLHRLVSHIAGVLDVKVEASEYVDQLDAACTAIRAHYGPEATESSLDGGDAPKGG